MFNSIFLQDLREFVENAPSPGAREYFENHLKQFAASLISPSVSPPAQKPVSELGGSGAGLVGNPSHSDSFLTCAHCGHRCNPLIDEFAGSPAWDCPDCGFLNLLDSVPGGSGAGLVGNPLGHQITDPCGFWVNGCNGDISARRILDERLLDFCDTLPATMTGDAWEAAAQHVIAIREKRHSNDETWRQIGQFLDSMPRAQS